MFAELNAVAEIPVVAEIKSLDTLETGETYVITQIRRTNTRWGEKVLVEYLVDKETQASYLPKRVGEKLLQNDGVMLNDLIQQTAAGNTAFKFLGGPYNSMLFIQINV